MLTRSNLNFDQISILKEFIGEKGYSAEETARAQAVLLLARNADLILIKEITGLGKSAIYKWKKRFITLGILALLNKEKKFKALLTKSQIKEIVKVLTKETSRAFDYETDFWTTTMLARLIEEQYAVRYKKQIAIISFVSRSKIHLSQVRTAISQSQSNSNRPMDC